MQSEEALDDDNLQGAMRKGVLPYRVGILLDAEIPGFSDMFVEAIRFGFEEAVDRRILDRPVETILRSAQGMPARDAAALAQQYKQLVAEQNVLAIIGPNTSDNALALLEDIERLHVSTFSICGSEEFGGRYAFNLSNGSLPDEPAVIAAWIAQQKYKRVAIIRDYPSVIGMEYTRYFRYASDPLGLSVVLEGNVSPIGSTQEIVDTLELARSANAEVLVHFGVGTLAARLNVALDQLGWRPPKIMCSCFMGSSYHPDFCKALEGWVGVDQFDDRNAIVAGLRSRYERARKGKRLLANSAVTAGYDVAQTIALGLSRMRIITPEALRNALETVRRLPAACGAPGTVISFGPYDHRGYKGADYLLLRRVKDGKIEFVGTAPVT